LPIFGSVFLSKGALQLTNYYHILGVHANATPASIKRAFRQKAKHLHPDVNPGMESTRKFQLANEAYQVLIDPDKRRLYDLRLRHGIKGATVYYRPSPAQQAAARRYAYQRREPEVPHVPTRFEKLFDRFLFFFMLLSGLGAIFFGIYRAAVEPVDGVNPYVGIVFGVVFTSLFLYLWDKKQRLGM